MYNLLKLKKLLKIYILWYFKKVKLLKIYTKILKTFLLIFTRFQEHRKIITIKFERIRRSILAFFKCLFLTTFSSSYKNITKTQK